MVSNFYVTIILGDVTMQRRKRKKKKKNKVFLVLGLLFIIALAVGAYILLFHEDAPLKEVGEKITKPEKKLQILDLDSDERPYAVMIDNNVGYTAHAGLQDAYLTYEIIVEGGLTRIMAIFKDKDTSLIGPVRSARHYFLDYALENDAIYGHYGWSEFAKNDIDLLGVDNLNGITNAQSAYWRDRSVAAPHNVFTSIENLKEAAESKGYRLTSNNFENFDYSVDAITLDQKEGAMPANNISIRYSYYHTTGYTYDTNRGVYLRSMDNQAHVDKVTQEQYYTKNIIIQKMGNHSIDNYGRQDIDDVSSGDGYYITNGYAVPIKWEKSGRSAKTKYTYLDGTTIQLNDGNTYVQIQPTDETLTITE